MLAEDFHLILSGQFAEFAVYMFEYCFIHFLRLHVRDSADGEFANDFGRDDGFGTWLAEGALDAMDGERRVPPSRHEGAVFVVEDSRLATERFVEVVHGVCYRSVKQLLLVGEGGDHFVDAGDKDLAGWGDKPGHDGHEVSHRFVSSAAEDTRVQILTWSGDFDRVIVAAAEAVSEARLLGAEPVIVGNADGIGVFEELFGFGFDEVVKAFGAIFLHALEAAEEVHREVDVGFLMGFDGVEPAENGAFVVGGAAAVHAALIVDGEFEGGGGPAIFHKGGLHVVVAVDEDGAFGLVVTIAGDYYGW